MGQFFQRPRSRHSATTIYSGLAIVGKFQCPREKHITYTRLKKLSLQDTLSALVNEKLRVVQTFLWERMRFLLRFCLFVCWLYLNWVWGQGKLTIQKNYKCDHCHRISITLMESFEIILCNQKFNLKDNICDSGK